jgi:hypothetical protein
MAKYRLKTSNSGRVGIRKGPKLNASIMSRLRQSENHSDMGVLVYLTNRRMLNPYTKILQQTRHTTCLKNQSISCRCTFPIYKIRPEIFVLACQPRSEDLYIFFKPTGCFHCISRAYENRLRSLVFRK